MGHYTAAKAIKQQLDYSNLDAEVEVIDWLEYASPRFADKYYAFYSFLVNKGSNFYNKWYRFYENGHINKKPELYHYFLGCFTRFLEEKRSDLIISTLPTCSQIVSQYKEKTLSTLPLITCVTDITGHSEWINQNTDLYLVGSQTVREKFIQKGVAADKIFETGIPVRMEFIKQPSSTGNSPESSKKKLLLMGGGLGMLPEAPDFYQGLNTLPDVEVTLITGKNQRLFEQLYGRYSNIKVYGFIENICEFMKEADLIITKPGGITTFEAIHSGVPIAALNPFMQQEIYNANYIQDMQIGRVIIGDYEKCLEDISNLLYDDGLEDYRWNIRQIKSHLEEFSLPEVIKESIDNRNMRFARYSAPDNRKNGDMLINEKISFNI